MGFVSGLKYLPIQQKNISHFQRRLDKNKKSLKFIMKILESKQLKQKRFNHLIYTCCFLGDKPKKTIFYYLLYPVYLLLRIIVKINKHIPENKLGTLYRKYIYVNISFMK